MQTKLLCFFFYFLPVFGIAQQLDTIPSIDSIQEEKKEKKDWTDILPVYPHIKRLAIPTAVVYGGVHAFTGSFALTKTVQLNMSFNLIESRLKLADSLDGDIAVLNPLFRELNSYYSTRLQRNIGVGVLGLSLVHSFVLARTKHNQNPYLTSPTYKALSSAFIPGFGQIQNGKIWKVPIVYAALGATAYFTHTNFQQYKKLRTLAVLLENKKAKEAAEYYAHFNALDGLDYSQLTSSSANQYAKLYKTRVDNLVLATLGVYVLQIVDALVDAHLSLAPKESDFSVLPNSTFNPITGSFEFGLNVTLAWK